MEKDSSQNNTPQPNGTLPPPPPKKDELYVSANFWLEILTHMDKKIRVLCEDYGYGKVGLTIKVHKEKIMEVEFDDNVRIRGLIEKAGNRAWQGQTQGTASGLPQDPVSKTEDPVK
jgi:hypothetical protein